MKISTQCFGIVVFVLFSFSIQAESLLQRAVLLKSMVSATGQLSPHADCGRFKSRAYGRHSAFAPSFASTWLRSLPYTEVSKQQYYNYYRPHDGVDLATPIQYYQLIQAA